MREGQAWEAQRRAVVLDETCWSLALTMRTIATTTLMVNAGGNTLARVTALRSLLAQNGLAAAVLGCAQTVAVGLVVVQEQSWWFASRTSFGVMTLPMQR